MSSVEDPAFDRFYTRIYHGSNLVTPPGYCIGRFLLVYETARHMVLHKRGGWRADSGEIVRDNSWLGLYKKDKPGKGKARNGYRGMWLTCIKRLAVHRGGYGYYFRLMTGSAEAYRWVNDGCPVSDPEHDREASQELAEAYIQWSKNGLVNESLARKRRQECEAIAWLKDAPFRPLTLRRVGEW